MKFKDIMVYANPKESHLEIPENSAGDGAFDSYSGGRQVSSYTSGDLVKHADQLWNDHFSGKDDHPVFMSLDLETPLAFSTFLANNTNHRKVIIPSSFNMTKILKSLRTQES